MKPTDIQIVAKFSVWKTLAPCSFLVLMCAFCWAQIPSLDEYVGHRYPTEVGRFLLLSATAIFTASLPLVAWHVWNLLSRPGALYIADGRLFIYWAYFQSVSVQQIIDAVDQGRSSPFGDRVRVSMSGRPDVTFETTFMAKDGSDVATAIRSMAGAKGDLAMSASPP